MSVTTGTGRQFGEGPLARVAAVVYTGLVIEGLLLLTTGPGLVLLVLLDRDASNLPLAAAAAVPVGPALSAALYAWHRRRADLTDLAPAAAFWRGYRLNLAGVLRIWLPLLGLLTIVALNLTHLGAAGVPGWWVVPLVLVATMALLWGLNALVITSLFVFRAVDVARLAAYFLVRTPSVTLGNAGLLAAALAVTTLASEAVLAVFAALFTAAFLRVAGPMTTAIERDFTA